MVLLTQLSTLTGLRAVWKHCNIFHTTRCGVQISETHFHTHTRPQIQKKRKVRARCVVCGGCKACSKGAATLGELCVWHMCVRVCVCIPRTPISQLRLLLVFCPKQTEPLSSPTYPHTHTVNTKLADMAALLTRIGWIGAGIAFGGAVIQGALYDGVCCMFVCVRSVACVCARARSVCVVCVCVCVCVCANGGVVAALFPPKLWHSSFFFVSLPRTPPLTQCTLMHTLHDTQSTVATAQSSSISSVVCLRL